MDILVGSTIILGIWAAVGRLVGVRYGSELSIRAARPGALHIGHFAMCELRCRREAGLIG